MLVTPDISDVVEVKPGSYPARIVKATIESTKKDPSKKYVAWHMQIFKGEGENEKLNGKPLPIHNTMLSGKGAFGIKQLYKAVTNEEYTTGTQFDTDDFIGRELYATVKPQKDNPEYQQIAALTYYTDQELVLQ